MESFIITYYLKSINQGKQCKYKGKITLVKLRTKVEQTNKLLKIVRIAA